jgi:A/G-specific adenine glycosylase
MEKYHGEFPREFGQIIELPGIGRSTAAAICALAFHERRAILDGNVKRVLARNCGIEGWTGNNKVEERLWQQAEALLPSGNVATYTQALMDMGATVCTRSKPKCVLCPVQTDCVALQSERITELPTPRPHKTVPERHATFLLLMHGNDILLEKRPGSGIWGGLWCPPQFDEEATALKWCAQQGIGELNTAAEWTTRCSPDSEISRGHGVHTLPTFIHTFTHFKLHITPLKIQLARKPAHATQPGSVWLDVEEALRSAIPTPVRKVLSDLLPSPSVRR